MTTVNFYQLLKKELSDLQKLNLAKGEEKLIDGFTKQPSPQAIIKGKKILFSTATII